MPAPADSAAHRTAQARRAALSSFLGTTIEYYDFLLYGAAAALVFTPLFFLGLPPAVGLAASMGTLAAGYLARLAGAVWFGNRGDRSGRRSTIVITMTAMGLSSGLIGLLPTSAQIGPASAVLLVLLRLAQGFAVGGEFGGAALMAAEHARPARRGLASSSAAMGAPAGAVLATGTMLLVTRLPEPALLGWGWRIPFVASFGLLAVGMFVRLRLDESPEYLRTTQTGGAVASPTRGSALSRVLRERPGELLRGTAVGIGAFTGLGVYGVFMLSHARVVGYTYTASLLAVMVGTAVGIALTPVFAVLSDRVGRRPVGVAANLLGAVGAFPAFWLVDSRSPALLLAVLVFGVGVVSSAVMATMTALLTELFPVDVRYTGVSTCYQLAQLVGSGFGPLIAAALVTIAAGGIGLLAGFVVVACGVSLLGLVGTPETAHRRSTLAVEGARRGVPGPDEVITHRGAG
jgi:MFS transporter, MHS family, shikimate and dehydroshikimate transport protein